jgi:hypothetical protein
VVIDVLDILLRREHIVVLKCFPSPILCILRGVEDNAMRVQMWIKRSGCLVLEKRRHNIACTPIPVSAAFADACRREPLQFRNRGAQRLAMSSYNPQIADDKRGNRHRLRRRDREVKEYAAIG